jgi:hypothetical protein
MRSFSLALNDRKHVLFACSWIREVRRQKLHTGLCLGVLRQQADSYIVKDNNVTNVCARISHTPQFLVSVSPPQKKSAQGIQENMVKKTMAYIKYLTIMQK